MAKFIVKRTGRMPLAFEGKELASFTTSPDRAHPNYSGKPGLWERVRIFRTKGGKYVLAITYFTAWQGQRDRHDAHVFSDLKRVFEYLSFHSDVNTWVIDELADQLGLEAVAEEVT